MIIKLPKGEIKVDGNPVLEDVRMNIASNNQLRLKLNYFPEHGNKVPLDIVVYEYTKPTIEKLTNVILYIDGEELNENVSFNVKLTYSIMNKRLNINGCVNNNNINRDLYRMSDSLVLLEEISRCM